MIVGVAPFLFLEFFDGADLTFPFLLLHVSIPGIVIGFLCFHQFRRKEMAIASAALSVVLIVMVVMTVLNMV